MIRKATRAAQTARHTMRRTTTVSLGTIEKRTGEPYVSFAPVALDYDATPLLLLSRLSEHTANIMADPRVSLLFDATREAEVPSDGTRSTLQGSITVDTEARSRRRYLARHPYAELYAGFTDFALYRVEPRRIHLIQGFGNARWMTGRDVLLEGLDLAALEAAETSLCGREVGGWSVSGLDPDGIDLGRDRESRRLWLDEPVTNLNHWEALLAKHATT